jgi:alanine dehydrogenase
MIIGVPREVKDNEFRVAITPAGVRELTTAGHSVLVESGAGLGSAISDAEFTATGASVVAEPGDIWSTVDMVLKVKEPTSDEYPLLGLRADQLIFTYLHLAASDTCTRALIESGMTAIAYETVRLPDGSLPLLIPMSEVAGRMAPFVGAHYLMHPAGTRGVLVCGVPGVRCGTVVILGAGVVGMAAATLAVGMHSDVIVLDRNLDRLRQFDHHFRGALETLAASTHAIEQACVGADIVIGAVLVAGTKAPTLVSDQCCQPCDRGRCSSTSPSTKEAASSRRGRPPIPTRSSK